MSETDSVDSFSLSAILLAARRWLADGRKTAVVAGPKMYRMLAMTYLIKRLHVYPTIEEAYAYLER